jgi:hypothetical protein
MMDFASKLNLEEVGRRYDHYMELKEVFLLGINVIDRMQPRYVSEADKTTKRELETAVKMIDKRLSYLTDYSTATSNYSDLAREIDRIPVHRTPSLTTGSPNEQTQKQDSYRPSNQEDSGGETANA